MKRRLKQVTLYININFSRQFGGVYQMFAKVLIITVMLIILLALGSSLVFLVRDGGTTKRTVKALTVRIGLSLLLFLFLFLAFSMGWIKPHSI